MIPHYLKHLENCYHMIDVNYELIKHIVKNAVGFLQNSDVSDFVCEHFVVQFVELVVCRIGQLL